MVSAVELLSITSRSVAWVAKEMVGSLMSKTLPAELNTRLPVVVVMMLRSPEVELMLRIPAPASSIASPVPALLMVTTSPDEAAKDWVTDNTLAVWVQVSAVPAAHVSANLTMAPDTVPAIAPAVPSSTVMLLEISSTFPVESPGAALKV